MMLALALLLGLDGGAEPPKKLSPRDPGFFRPMQSKDMDARMLRGLEALRQNRPDESLRQFTAALNDDPDSARLQGLVGIAHLHLNQCEEGWAWLQPVRHRKNFVSASADKLAACWARRGDFSEAVFWQQESILLEPDRAAGWALLALYELRAGDHQAMELALGEAALLDENLLRSAMVRAMAALSAGDVEGVDEQLVAMRGLDWPAPVVAASLEARLELDLGNLARAIRLAVIAQPGPKHIGELALQAEATRRAGHIEEAAWLLSQRDFSDSVVPDLHAVQARVLVDQGRTKEAEDLLGPLLELSPWDADLLASAWYLAQARGRTLEAEQLARRYDGVQTSPLRPLEALRPDQ